MVIKMECNMCDGSGYVVREDYVHDVLVKERCNSCLQEDRQKEEIYNNMRVLLASVSPQLLAQYLSQVIIHVGANKHSLDALEQQILAKNKTGLLSWVSLLE